MTAFERGCRVSDWKIDVKLGEGAFGAVYKVFFQVFHLYILLGTYLRISIHFVGHRSRWGDIRDEN